MSTVEFREAGLILSQISSRRCCHISHIRGRMASSRAISWHSLAPVKHPLDGLPLVFCESGVALSDGFLGISAPPLSRSRAGPSGPTIEGYPPHSSIRVALTFESVSLELEIKARCVVNVRGCRSFPMRGRVVYNTVRL